MIDNNFQNGYISISLVYWNITVCDTLNFYKIIHIQLIIRVMIVKILPHTLCNNYVKGIKK